MNHGTGRDVLQQRQVVARLDISLSTGLDDVALLDALRRDDVTLLAICEVQEGDTGGTVRIVLDLGNLGGTPSLSQRLKSMRRY